jgi:hypothetical protein
LGGVVDLVAAVVVALWWVVVAAGFVVVVCAVAIAVKAVKRTIEESFAVIVIPV